MARGNEAKEKLINKIIQMPNISFIGCYDKKYYFFEEENGEKIQIAITMTCPKNPVGEINFKAEIGNSLNFEDMSAAPVFKSSEPAEITDQERENIANLMAKLGL